MPAEIEVRIKNGKISIEVSGVDDATCADITQALESNLGEVEDIQRKPEYYIEMEGTEQRIYEDND